MRTAVGVFVVWAALDLVAVALRAASDPDGALVRRKEPRSAAAPPTVEYVELCAFVGAGDASVEVPSRFLDVDTEVDGTTFLRASPELFGALNARTDLGRREIDRALLVGRRVDGVLVRTRLLADATRGDVVPPATTDDFVRVALRFVGGDAAAWTRRPAVVPVEVRQVVEAGARGSGDWHAEPVSHVLVAMNGGTCVVPRGRRVEIFSRAFEGAALAFNGGLPPPASAEIAPAPAWADGVDAVLSADVEFACARESARVVVADGERIATTFRLDDATTLFRAPLRLPIDARVASAGRATLSVETCEGGRRGVVTAAGDGFRVDLRSAAYAYPVAASTDPPLVDGVPTCFVGDASDGAPEASSALTCALRVVGGRPYALDPTPLRAGAIVQRPFADFPAAPCTGTLLDRALPPPDRGPRATGLSGRVAGAPPDGSWLFFAHPRAGGGLECRKFGRTFSGGGVCVYVDEEGLFFAGDLAAGPCDVELVRRGPDGGALTVARGAFALPAAACAPASFVVRGSALEAASR